MALILSGSGERMFRAGVGGFETGVGASAAERQMRAWAMAQELTGRVAFHEVFDAHAAARHTAKFDANDAWRRLMLEDPHEGLRQA